MLPCSKYPRFSVIDHLPSSYMKTNNNTNNGGYLCGVTGTNCTTGDWRKAYANYLVQYLKDYQEAGISYDYIGFLNEPEEK